MAEEIRIGHVTHYFGKVQVAAIDLTEGDLTVGDTVRFKGHTTDFTQTVDSIQIEHESVPRAPRGQSVGIRVMDHARVDDIVYKVTA